MVFLHRENLPQLGQWLRSLRYLDRQLEGHQPWLSFGAIDYMAQRLRRDSHVFEYGSGGSTLWFADRVGHVTSVEHDAGWCGRVAHEIKRARLENCTLWLRGPRPWSSAENERVGREHGFIANDGAGSFDEYVRSCEAFGDESFDLVLVDGKARLACLHHAASKVRTGGLLALDDSENPRLQPALARFADWPSETFEGLRPGSISRSRTTFWIRPATTPEATVRA